MIFNNNYLLEIFRKINLKNKPKLLFEISIKTKIYIFKKKIIFKFFYI